LKANSIEKNPIDRINRIYRTMNVQRNGSCRLDFSFVASEAGKGLKQGKYSWFAMSLKVLNLVNPEKSC
jgi:hypothetical protein